MCDQVENKRYVGTRLIGSGAPANCEISNSFVAFLGAPWPDAATRERATVLVCHLARKVRFETISDLE
jgi:hypothetical protein